MTRWAALVRPCMEDCPVLLLSYQKDVDKPEQETTRLVREGVLALWGDAEGLGLVWLGENFGGTYEQPSHTYKVLLRRWSQALYRVAHQENKRLQPWTRMRQIWTWGKEKPFLHEDSQALAQVARRGCGVFTLGDTKKLTGQIAE